MKVSVSSLAVTVAILGACSKRAPVTPAPIASGSATAARPDTATRRREEEGRRFEAARNRFLLEEMIFFDFNRAEVRPDARASMDAKAGLLRTEPRTRLRIDGHADERGSDEYNLALGMRRANAAKQYLVRFGADPDQIEAQSFGEEHPLDPRHTEAGWALNRRAEFIILSGPLAAAP